MQGDEVARVALAEPGIGFRDVVADEAQALPDRERHGALTVVEQLTELVDLIERTASLVKCRPGTQL